LTFYIKPNKSMIFRSCRWPPDMRGVRDPRSLCLYPHSLPDLMQKQISKWKRKRWGNYLIYLQYVLGGLSSKTAAPKSKNDFVIIKRNLLFGGVRREVEEDEELKKRRSASECEGRRKRLSGAVWGGGTLWNKGEKKNIWVGRGEAPGFFQIPTRKPHRAVCLKVNGNRNYMHGLGVSEGGSVRVGLVFRGGTVLGGFCTPLATW
jgi:hypothetical protein